MIDVCEYVIKSRFKYPAYRKAHPSRSEFPPPENCFSNASKTFPLPEGIQCRRPSSVTQPFLIKDTREKSFAPWKKFLLRFSIPLSFHSMTVRLSSTIFVRSRLFPFHYLSNSYLENIPCPSVTPFSIFFICFNNYSRFGVFPPMLIPRFCFIFSRRLMEIRRTAPIRSLPPYLRRLQYNTCVI